MNKSAAIIQRRLTHYRVPFFTRLREKLKDAGISLDVYYGSPTAKEQLREDGGSLPWAKPIRNTYLLGDRACWQWLPSRIKSHDLVVIPHENGLLRSQLLLLNPARPLVAFWGHGANFQARKPNSLREAYKRWTANRVDWWFGYTDSTAQKLSAAGFPSSRTTIVNNAIDGEQLLVDLSEIHPEEAKTARKKYGATPGATACFIGSLTPEKNLGFLLEAAALVRQNIPEFQLLVVGAGVHSSMVQEYCQDHSWIQMTGPLSGREKAMILKISDLLLLPSAVGLSVLDSFIAGTPLITTAAPNHGPEIAYLVNNTTGIVTPENSIDYANAIVRTLTSPRELARLSRNCLDASSHYTLNNMVERFSSGIQSALDVAPFETMA